VKVALVSSEGRCGIAEHSAMLQQSVQAADPEIEFARDVAWLDPNNYANDPIDPDILHLNYHRGLHSRWTQEWVESMRKAAPFGKHSRVVITFHDTYETQPDRLAWDLLDACDAMIVHEPCDLQDEYAPTLNRNRAKVHYWRQGVPQPSGITGRYTRHHAARPIVGTCGFAFPWKGFELLCDAAKLAGWGVKICSHNATIAQAADWHARNPWLTLATEYYSTDQLIAELGTCDATAFLYSCANSGTSGAIRLGIAAGKPLLATQGCRQFRDLADAAGPHFVRATVEDVSTLLEHLYLQRFDAGIVTLRERDSWEHLGKKYATLYRSLVS
jgi:hypothetical protein